MVRGARRGLPGNVPRITNGEANSNGSATRISEFTGFLATGKGSLSVQASPEHYHLREGVWHRQSGSIKTGVTPRKGAEATTVGTPRRKAVALLLKREPASRHLKVTAVAADGR